MENNTQKVAIITGSSRGIGKAVALLFAEKGYSVVLNGRNKDRLLLAEKDLLKIHDRVLFVCCDVSLKEGGEKLIKTTLKTFKRVDVLINNVGVSSRGFFADLSFDVFKSVFYSNVFGSISPTIPAIPELRKTKGSVVFVSSLAGIRGLPFLAPYSSSKMSLRALAESLRVEEKRNGIHVGLVLVGITEIEHNKEAVSADGSLVVLKNRKKRRVQKMSFVAQKIYKNVKNRRFISTLTTIGKINAFLSPILPLFVEKIIEKNLNTFIEKSK